MKIVKYYCDFCGRELDPYLTNICTLEGNRNEKHMNHSFRLYVCRFCYDKFYNDHIYQNLIEELQKSGRRIL